MTAETSATSARTLARRRGLPNTRAVVGALLLTVAGVGTFAVASDRAASDPPSYVVLARDVAPGARIGPGDLRFASLTLDASVASHAFTDAAPLTDAVALGPLAAGQLLQRAEVATASATGAEGVSGAVHELTIPLSADRVPPRLRRGEVVAVLATYGSGGDARTVVAVQRATVLGVGDAGDGLSARGTVRLTVAIAEPTTVVSVAHAAQVADLTVVRATLADGQELPATSTAEERARGEAS